MGHIYSTLAFQPHILIIPGHKRENWAWMPFGKACFKVQGCGDLSRLCTGEYWLVEITATEMGKMQVGDPSSQGNAGADNPAPILS